MWHNRHIHVYPHLFVSKNAVALHIVQEHCTLATMTVIEKYTLGQFFSSY